MSNMLQFKKRLANHSTLFGPAITLSDYHVTDALAPDADFIWIDLEHCAMSPEVFGSHLIAARVHNTPALVRVSHTSTPFIKTVLDAGAEGVIIPQVRSVSEVRAVIDDCYYPPAGKRGYGPRVPGCYGRHSGPAFMEEQNTAVFVGIQIETLEAVEQLEAISSVQGVTSLVIGPYDLSIALGVPGELEHPKLLSTVDKITDICSRKGLYAGAGMGANEKYAEVLLAHGVQWLQVGSDFDYLVQRGTAILSLLRERTR